MEFVRGAQHNLVSAEQSGYELLDLVRTRLNWQDFSNKRILDIGCGTRLAQAIVSNQIDLAKYVGLDVFKQQIQFLQKAVDDPRLEFHHIDLYNKMYNLDGTVLTLDYQFPLGNQQFDIIGLFSVFTHLEPQDVDCMLHIMKRYLTPNGKIIFSVLINNDISGFNDMDPDKPLLFAAYSEALIRHLLVRNGWRIISFNPKKKAAGEFTLIQPHFVCELI
jgi:SAM-dependent methyltransferase